MRHAQSQLKHKSPSAVRPQHGTGSCQDVFDFECRITAIVVDHKRIEFEGEVTSLSAAALKIVHRMGYTWQQIAGPSYWEFEGETLSARRERLESSPAD